MRLQADYVIVGAGSAGCALAAGLSEDGAHEVALLEYGGSEAGPLIQMPAALSYPMGMARYDWGLRERTRAAPGRTARGLPARQGDRRLVVDQRHGLCARPPARLRALGRMRRARLGRELAAQEAFAAYRGHEIAPGDAVRDDAALDAWLRDALESAYHPCGTCRMGAADDPMVVVDPECRVIGVDGLRVADSSIFPRITNGNLNAPSMMVGEKAADHILGRAPLAPVHEAPWINPRWESSDR